MSFSRQPYDPCAYKEHLKESKKNEAYYVNEPRNCPRCFEASPYVRGGKFGGSVCEDDSIIDTSSELLGLCKRQSHCIDDKHKPFAVKCNLKHEKDCSNFLGAEDTRLSNPLCTARETTINRFQWLPCNEQDHAISKFPWIPVNNRLLVKDNHRPCNPDTKIISQPMLKPNNDGISTGAIDKNASKCMRDNVMYYSQNLRSCREIAKL